MTRRLNALAALAMMCGGLTESPSAPAMLRRLSTRPRPGRTLDPLPVLAHESSMALAQAGIGFFGTDAGAYYLGALPGRRSSVPAPRSFDADEQAWALDLDRPCGRVLPLARLVPVPDGRLVVRPVAQFAPDVRALVDAWVAGQREEGVAVVWGAGVPRTERIPTAADLSPAMPKDMFGALVDRLVGWGYGKSPQDAEPHREPDDVQEAEPQEEPAP